MAQDKQISRSKEVWAIVFLVFFVLVNWPFLLNMETLTSRFVFFYFFVSWAGIIVLIFYISKKHETSLFKKKDDAKDV